MRKLLILPAFALALATTTAAFAEDDAATPVVPRDQWMSVDEISAKFKAEGYDVRQVKVEANGYEVYAVSKTGEKLEADVNPATGEIVKQESGD